MDRILGVILAGGASRRFGRDKAFADLLGVPLIEHVARRAQDQVDVVAVSGGATLAALNLPVIADREPAQGPLRGIESSLAWATAGGFNLVATFPCDGPLFPVDLVARLGSALGCGDLAMVRCGLDRHYTYGLWRTAAQPAVASMLADGVRSLRDAANALSATFLDCEPADFLNINRPEDLARAELLFAQRTPS